MIDAPGPWGTGAFTLVEGASSISAEQAVISRDPFAATWLQHEDRTPSVRLVANPNYWDKGRGPRLQEVQFRNDLDHARALDLVCDADGEVDILTEVSPADAERVERSQHAKLVKIDAVRAVAGVINRDADGLPLADRRARQALNHAVDRAALIIEAMFGHADPLAALTPPSAVSVVNRLSPYRHDPARAAELWRDAGGAGCRTLRLAAPEEQERAANKVAADIRQALGIGVDVRLYYGAERLEVRRHLAEKRPHDWDVWIQEQGAQAADAPPMELHRAFCGVTGEHRAGPPVAEVDAMYLELMGQTSPAAQTVVANRIEKFVYDEALALFLYAPHALYAVNKHVDFVPYRTTFELAECEADAGHWSRR